MVNKCFLASLLVVCQVCYAGWSVGTSNNSIRFR
jgi:hypothetical protein